MNWHAISSPEMYTSSIPIKTAWDETMRGIYINKPVPSTMASPIMYITPNKLQIYSFDKQSNFHIKEYNFCKGGMNKDKS